MMQGFREAGEVEYPAAVHAERVAAGQDRVCGHHRVCAVLVPLRLCHAHLLGRVSVPPLTLPPVCLHLGQALLAPIQKQLSVVVWLAV